MQTRTDEHGSWTSDDGLVWLLAEPSQAWLDETQRPSDSPDPEIEAEAVARAVLLASALLADPERLETLVSNVTNTAKGPLTYVAGAITHAAEVTP